MFLVSDIYDEAKKIIGTCDEPKFFRKITDAVTLIANKADFEAWKGYIDICTTGNPRCVILPREVETVLAVNINGTPTLGKDQLFNFHLNGLGDCRTSCTWTWQDQGGFHSTYRDLITPSRLVAYLQRSDDNGKTLLVHGYDNSGNRLRHQVSGQWRDGIPIPLIFGYAIPDSSQPQIARIIGVTKDITNGTVRLSTIDDSGLTGTLLAVYEPDERLPQYRRIKLSNPCQWVRIAYRRNNPTLSSKWDRIPLKSRIGYLLAVKAVKYYDDDDLARAHVFEADAARLELEAQSASEPPVLMTPQVVDLNQIQDKTDFNIV